MQAGSIVVCVDDKNWSSDIHERFDKLPVKDVLYTVRMIIPNIIDPDGPPGVALEEIEGRMEYIKAYTGEMVLIEFHFRMNRFREIQPPISISTEIRKEEIA